MIDNISRSLITDFKFNIYHPFIKAINEYNLIEENDKIAICISGGKDSFVMAKCFSELLKYSKFRFEVVFLLMNPGYDNNKLESIIDNSNALNIPLTIFNTNIFKVVDMQSKNKCYICAKMRRGALYNKAKELGCNKIALGHHFDDVIETTLMSLFYSGSIETMLPKVKSDNYDNMFLIRPLYLVREKDIINFEKENNLSFLKQGCFMTNNYDLCQSSKRQQMKKLIRSLDDDNDTVSKNIFKALSNVNIDKVLGIKKKKN